MAVFYTGFEWDPIKALLNKRKHGISFEDAIDVFDDPFSRLIRDPDHSDQEERFVLMGADLNSNVLIICHCYREPGRTIRVISARKATKQESTTYWRFRNEK